MLDGISSFIVKFDFMSENLSFEKDGKKNDQNIYGAILSWIIILSSLVLSTLFGKELIERKLPKTSGYSDFIDSSKFSLNDFPVFFEISDVMGNLVFNWEDYFMVYGGKINYTNNNPVFFNANFQKSKKCEFQDLEALTKYVTKDEITRLIKSNPLICIQYDHESIVENDYSKSNSSFINIAFDYKDATYGDIVKSDYLLKKDDFYVKTYFINNYINSADLENPVKFFIDSNLQQITSDFLRRIYIRFTSDKFISDNGWILKDEKQTDFLGFKSVESQINSKSQLLKQSIYWVTISSPQISNITYRSYIKIQDLASQIGGIINSLVILISILFSNFLRFIYMTNVSNHILLGEIQTYSFSKKNNMASILKSGINNSNINSNISRFKILKENEKNEKMDIENSKIQINNVNNDNINENRKDKNENRYKIDEVKENKIEYESKKLENKLEPNSNVINEKYNSFLNSIKKNTDYSGYLKSLQDYLLNENYFNYIYEGFKTSLCCNLEVDKMYLSTRNFYSRHTDFFEVTRKMTVISGLIDEGKDE